MEWLASNISSKKVEIKFVSGSIFALASRIVPRVASTLLFIVLMRREGPAMAGAYSLSIAFLTSAVLLSSFGLEELVVREVAKEPSHSHRYLVNVLWLRGFLSLVGYGVIAGLVTLALDYDTKVQRIILLQGIGILPEGLMATIFAVFNANQKFNWMAFVTFCVSVFQLVVGGLALWMGAGLETLIFVLLTGSWLGVIISVHLFNRFATSICTTVPENRPKRHWSPDWTFCKQQLKNTIPFAVVISLTSLDIQLDMILLSALQDLSAVGAYSAARMIVLLLSLVPQAIRMVIYPSISCAYAAGEREVRRVYNQSWYYLALLGLPLTLGVTILARPILDLFYRHVSVATVWALRVLMLHLLVGFLYLPGTRLMVVSDRQIWLSTMLGFSAGLNLLFSLLLVPCLGVVGASVARATSSLIYFLSVELYVLRFILPRHRGAQRALKPLLAATVMAVTVWLLRGCTLYAVVPLGVLLYGLGLLVLNIPLLKGQSLRQALGRWSLRS